MGELDGKVVVITGGGSGIGRGIASVLAREGADLVITDLDLGHAERVAGELGGVALAHDVTSWNSCVEMVDRVLAERGQLDVLVNNAGVSLQGFDAEVARRTLDVNYFGARNVTDRLLPLVRPGGRIVMVSSGMGELSSVSDGLKRRFLNPALTQRELDDLMESFVRDVAAGTHSKNGWPSSAYRVSKIGLNALTRILARDLGDDPRRILVNAVCPGWVRTDMGGSGAPRSPEQGAETAIWAAVLDERGPTGRFFRDKREIAW
jgi:NAD(P)-dependent dehydrogenase (short-subunit alcohol dehydrogenase family)